MASKGIPVYMRTGRGLRLYGYAQVAQTRQPRKRTKRNPALYWDTGENAPGRVRGYEKLGEIPSNALAEHIAGLLARFPLGNMGGTYATKLAAKETSDQHERWRTFQYINGEPVVHDFAQAPRMSMAEQRKLGWLRKGRPR